MRRDHGRQTTDHRAHWPEEAEINWQQQQANELRAEIQDYMLFEFYLNFECKADLPIAYCQLPISERD
jgi:hypothetical protein